MVVIGLDDAGKTHILQTIADNELQLLKPTHGFGIMSLLINGFTLNLWDIGEPRLCRLVSPNPIYA